MMGILPEKTDDNIKTYAVESLMAPSNIKNFFNDQKTSIPTQILVTTSDSMKKIEATPSEKIFLLNQYKAIINEYGLTNKLNVYGDYEAILAEKSQNKIRKKSISNDKK